MDQRIRYRFIPEELGQEIFSIVEEWKRQNATASVMWNDGWGCAKTAIAEYLANQAGYTMYNSFAKEEEGDGSG